MSDNRIPPPNRLVARLGVKRARVYMAVWFAYSYVLMVTLGIVVCVVFPDLAEGNRLVRLGVIVIVLEITGLIMLTRMAIAFVKECRLWEKAQRDESRS